MEGTFSKHELAAWNSNTCCVSVLGAGVLSIHCDVHVEKDHLTEVFKDISETGRDNPLAVTVASMTVFESEAFALISDKVITLVLQGVTNFHSSLFSQIKLPNLVHLEFQGCHGITLAKGDFVTLNHLRTIVMKRSGFVEFRQNVLEEMPCLTFIGLAMEVVTADQWATLDKQDWRYLQLLHCSSEMQWLRVYLKERPSLTSRYSAGHIWKFKGYGNDSFHESLNQRELFLSYSVCCSGV
ncbi:hypothetical protein BV898_01443 [Hypsibius exemplaris]|uniref:Uncharacterized protein n=1 Tax=Hypsibius exemplaris TaxID=2072580 RepID=A0A1W0XBG6_HYPEX|nr:hypothetical protein BV898_01443 [Hypsibius exemplaris]